MKMKTKEVRALITAWAHIGTFNGVEKVAIVFQAEELIMQHGPYLGQYKIYTVKYDVGSDAWNHFLHLCGVEKLTRTQDLLHRELTLEIEVNGRQVLRVLPQNLNWLYVEFKPAAQEIPQWVTENANRVYTGVMVPHRACQGARNVKKVKVEPKSAIVIDVLLKQLVARIERGN
jgi:hypothetical protein